MNWRCQYCHKVLFDPVTRVCRWRVAKLEFVPNGSQGPMPVMMAKCPTCKNFGRINLPEMLASAREHWDAARR